jgi:hypothetical protein
MESEKSTGAFPVQEKTPFARNPNLQYLWIISDDEVADTPRNLTPAAGALNVIVAVLKQSWTREDFAVHWATEPTFNWSRPTALGVPGSRPPSYSYLSIVIV